MALFISLFLFSAAATVHVSLAFEPAGVIVKSIKYDGVVKILQFLRCSKFEVFN
jgi:hypothetical protein